MGRINRNISYFILTVFFGDAIIIADINFVTEYRELINRLRGRCDLRPFT
mgnify:CR=1 FL=1